MCSSDSTESGSNYEQVDYKKLYEDCNKLIWDIAKAFGFGECSFRDWDDMSWCLLYMAHQESYYEDCLCDIGKKLDIGDTETQLELYPKIISKIDMMFEQMGSK